MLKEPSDQTNNNIYKRYPLQAKFIDIIVPFGDPMANFKNNDTYSDAHWSVQKQKSLKNRPNEESEFLPCLILYFDLHWCSEVKINSLVVIMFA